MRGGTRRKSWTISYAADAVVLGQQINSTGASVAKQISD